MAKHKAARSKTARLDSDATQTVTQYAALTGKSETFIASFLIKTSQGLILGTVSGSECARYLEALAKARKARVVAEKAVRAARSDVPQMPGSVQRKKEVAQK